MLVVAHFDDDVVGESVERRGGIRGRAVGEYDDFRARAARLHLFGEFAVYDPEPLARVVGEGATVRAIARHIPVRLCELDHFVTLVELLLHSSSGTTMA
ncbi:MAG: hypothetical protein A3K19_18310 [Lentisphaerae bacterium RIFOXYB12_FULL_65_16]|nr:MAG: hypothetical protein A3K18_03455 [Lentisphaerae bacterium RIFOXYA12_64_32]OGV87303.1 MAG: hypothetical protein A3K19_18310 [Lentisphaerae bacterium RIFOXYB12_FULL_65_16]